MHSYTCKACNDGELIMIQREREKAIKFLLECNECGASPSITKLINNHLKEVREHPNGK